MAELDGLEGGADAAHGEAGAAEMVAAAAELDLVCNVFVGGAHGCFASADLQVCAHISMADGGRDPAPYVNTMCYCIDCVRPAYCHATDNEVVGVAQKHMHLTLW